MRLTKRQESLIRSAVSSYETMLRARVQGNESHEQLARDNMRLAENLLNKKAKK